MNNKKAFSVLEVLIAITIFLVITGMILANYKKSENSNIFRLQSFDIEDSIRLVQNMSITGQKINGQIPGNAYGISFDKTLGTYKIFGDSNDDYKGYFNNSDLLGQEYVINNKLSFNSFCNNDVKRLDILFYAPKGTIKIFTYTEDNGIGMSEYNECNISLKSLRADGTWNINVSTSTNRISSTYTN